MKHIHVKLPPCNPPKKKALPLWKQKHIKPKHEQVKDYEYYKAIDQKKCPSRYETCLITV